MFEKFAIDHSDVFMKCLEMDDSDEDLVHPVEFYDVYQSYLNKFSSIIEEHITSNGFKINDFYLMCRHVIDQEETFGSRRFFIEAMLATSEYETFYTLMKKEMEALKSMDKSEAKTDHK
jgi:hypothetical protein